MGDHDSLFKRAFAVPRNAAGEIQSILPASVVERMDLTKLELLPNSFVDEEMEHRHADLLFRAPIDGKDAYLYFLLEHQSEPDALMPYRVLSYMLRIWGTVLRHEPERRTLPVVVPLIIHHGRSGWTAPRRLHDLVDGLDDLPELARAVPDFELLIDDLVDVDDEALLARPLEAFPKVALWALRDARSVESLLGSLRQWGHELERLVAADPGEQDIRFVMRYILRVAGERPFETLRKKVIEVAPAVEASMASFAEQLIQQGVQQGREEGVLQGSRKTLSRLLQLRFGALDSAIEARIADGSSEDVDGWLDQVLTAETLDDIFAD